MGCDINIIYTGNVNIMVKVPGWRQFEKEFQDLSDNIYSGNINKKHEINEKLEGISHSVKVRGVSNILISYLEFLFFRAQGPYSLNFQKYSKLIKIIIKKFPELRALLNENGAHTLGNMVLDGRGKLKFPLSDALEFQEMLDFWERCGLKTLTPRKVFKAILEKKGVKTKISSGDPKMIIRLVSIFPMYQEDIIPDNIDYNSLIKEIKDPSIDYFEDIIQSYFNSGLTLYDIIKNENNRLNQSFTYRNQFLAYLVKRSHGFNCQICENFLPSKVPSNIQVHHIVPLSEKGLDRSDNMLVTCHFHHKEIHFGRIQVDLGDKIWIRANGKSCSIERN